MEKNYFAERAQVRMAGLGLTQQQLADLLGQPRSSVTKAIQGYTSPAVNALRVPIDQALTKKVDEKRKQMIEDAKPHLAEQVDLDSWAVSMILPEDMQYIVTHYGSPVGTYNPVTKKYTAFEEV